MPAVLGLKSKIRIGTTEGPLQRTVMGTSCVFITHCDSRWPVPDPQSALGSSALLEVLDSGP